MTPLPTTPDHPAPGPECVPLPRKATVAQWQAGRAFRRLLATRLNGPAPLRRQAGDPRKDAVLRELNAGERGARFATLDELRQMADKPPACEPGAPIS